MNCLVWNCRGEGARNPQTVRELDGFVRRYNPKLVFLSETMISESRVKNLRWRLGLKGCLAIDSRGKRGGLALFWDENTQVNLLSINDRYIDVSICDCPNGAPWRATFVYGEPRVEDWHKLWEIMERLKTRSWEPWVVIGDFNEAMWQYEHFSKSKRGKNKWRIFERLWMFVG